MWSMYQYQNDDNIKKILLVDDDNYILTLVHKHLSILNSSINESLEIDMAQDVDTAKKLLEENKYDLIITDYMLGSGRTADEIIEHIAHTKNVRSPYKIMTSIRDSLKLKQLVQGGASGVIYKPFTFDDISKNISTITSIKQKEYSHG